MIVGGPLPDFRSPGQLNVVGSNELHERTLGNDN